MREAHPGVTQPWYADYSGVGSTFGGIRSELAKSILVVSPRNVLQAEAFFRGYGLQIMTGSRYLGGFVGSKAVQDCWLGEKV